MREIVRVEFVYRGILVVYSDGLVARYALIDEVNQCQKI